MLTAINDTEELGPNDDIDTSRSSAQRRLLHLPEVTSSHGPHGSRRTMLKAHDRVKGNAIALRQQRATQRDVRASRTAPTRVPIAQVHETHESRTSHLGSPVSLPPQAAIAPHRAEGIHAMSSQVASVSNARCHGLARKRRRRGLVPPQRSSLTTSKGGGCTHLDRRATPHRSPRGDEPIVLENFKKRSTPTSKMPFWANSGPHGFSGTPPHPAIPSTVPPPNTHTPRTPVHARGDARRRARADFLRLYEQGIEPHPGPVVHLQIWGGCVSKYGEVASPNLGRLRLQIWGGCVPAIPPSTL